MSTTLTVDKDKAREQGDLAAQASRPPLVRDAATAAMSIEAAELAGVGASKRKRTSGELLFDVTTYGGLALVGNEVVSTYIVKQAEKPTAFGRFFEQASNLTKKIGPAGKMPYTQSGRFNYINFAIIGGFTMVPFIKFFEDNKGRLVRAADSILHGVQADTDPEIRAAHEEMDNAPKQTWGSLLKGRVLTVLAAWGVDASINWKDGWTGRALKGTKLEGVSSLEAITGRVADKMGDSIAKHKGLDVAKTANLKSWLNQGFGLLSLSAALTVLFYASSKVFASRSEQKREIQSEHEHAVAASEEKQGKRTVHLDQLERGDMPGTAVSAIEAQSRLATQPERSVGA